MRSPASEKAAERTAKMAALIARMPKPVRDEVARLHAEIARLNAVIEARGAVGSRISIHTVGGQHADVPLDEDCSIRFTGPKAGKWDSYIEACIAQTTRGAIAGHNEVEMRSGHGRIIVLPGSANSVIIREDHL